MRKPIYAALAVTFAVALTTNLSLRAFNETIDYDAINKIKTQGLVESNSKVMEVMSYLTDVNGPRLTGSPNIEKAGQWAVKQMSEWGLTGAAMEPWTADPTGGNNGFPRGWVNEKFYLAAVAPQQFPIVGTPTAWTPGTNGLVRGNAMMVTENTLEEIKQYAGKLKGAWVMRAAAPDVPAYFTAPGKRYTKEELDAMEAPPRGLEFGVANPNAAGRGGAGGGRGNAPAAAATPGVTPCAGGGRGAGAAANPCDEFFKTEGVAGFLSTAPRGHGIYTIGGSAATEPVGFARVVITAEHYGRIARMLAKNIPVTLEADIKNTYQPNPPMFNVVAEIKGTDKADEIVMLGAHFDSWHAATGATDNAAGSAAMMEAMRILKQSGVKLRRTVRIGLWTGEEEGLLGSRMYMTQHFGTAGRGGGGGGAGRGAGAATATPAPPPPPQSMATWTPVPTGVTNIKPEWNKFAAYFNIDNGTGAIRGIYLQQNQAVAPIFREWIEPFRGIGMTHINVGNTGGTDHQSYDAIGLPGFQFIQDEVEYNAMTHHTNLDTYERIQPEDMRRNATIAAAFAFLAANRDEKLPHKPATPLTGGGRGGH